MPGRKVPLVNKQTYHILNRGIAHQPIFQNRSNYRRVLETIAYYQFQNPPLRYSHYIRLNIKEKSAYLKNLKKKNLLVENVAYCLMPNHLHFLLRQLKDNGISTFMSNLANSYTRYFNTKYKRVGPLFQGKFKAVRVETDEQLVHLSRYIHLNPFTSYVVKSIKQLEKYPHSSLPEYLNLQKTSMCAKQMILDRFINLQAYKKFVFDQAHYQRKLQNIKHLLFEKLQ